MGDATRCSLFSRSIGPPERRLAWRPGLAAACAGLLALVLSCAGCSSSLSLGRPGRPGRAAEAGAATFLAAAHGVVWSFENEGGSGVVLRSTDNGQSFRVALPLQRQGFGLEGSYFLGPSDAWVIDAARTTRVMGTTDGGKAWWQSAAIQGAGSAGCCGLLFEQLYFSSPKDGYLLGVSASDSLADQSLTTYWWQTTDGGHHWRNLPAMLPIEGRLLGPYGLSTCPVFSPPQLVFITAEEGFLTEGACGSGRARPLVWQTVDRGRHWKARRLPAPPAGWGRWAVNSKGGTDVGQVFVVSGSGGRKLLLPVAVGRSDLVVERSDDMGRSWMVASVLDTRAGPTEPGAASWFDPIDASKWVVAAPGGLIETSDGGRSWRSYRSSFSPTVVVPSFRSLSDGFLQGSGLVGAMRTRDHGRSFAAGGIVVSPGELRRWQPGWAVSTVQIVDPRLAVAGGVAGLETSVDGGRSWVPRLGDLTPVSEVDFLSDKVGFVLAGGSLMLTTDQGRSWRRLLLPVSGAVSGAQFWSARAGAVSIGREILLTSNDGGSWRPLRLPPGYFLSTPPALVQGQATPVCFATSGVGWAAAVHDGRVVVLVSPRAGRHWRVALPARAFPPGAEPGRAVAAVLLAGCRADGAFAIVEQAGGPFDMQGVPVAYDLLHTADMGRSWLDVLRSASYEKVGHPRLSSPPGGPTPGPSAPGSSAGLEPPATPSQATAWFTVVNEDFGGLVFAVTADGGRHWRIEPPPAESHSTALPSPSGLPAAAEWLATTSLDATHAWALLGLPGHRNTSYLYDTSDGGSSWQRLASFGWGKAEQTSSRR